MLIGLSGKPSSGKSTVSKILVRDYGFQILDTKKVLRDITSLITGVQSESLKQEAYKASKYLDVTNREIMGEIGNTLESLFGEDFLFRKALQSPWMNTGKKIVVDSLRKDQALTFPGFVVEIKSPKVIDTDFDFDKYNQDKIAFIINNSGNISDLEQQISNMTIDLAHRSS